MQWESTKAFESNPLVPLTDAELKRWRMNTTETQAIPGRTLACLIMRLDQAEIVAKAQLANVNDLMTGNQRLMADNVGLMDQNRALMSELTNTGETHQRVADELDNLQEHNAELRAELDRAAARIEQDRKVIATLRDEVRRLQSESLIGDRDGLLNDADPVESLHKEF